MRDPERWWLRWALQNCMRQSVRRRRMRERLSCVWQQRRQHDWRAFRCGEAIDLANRQTAVCEQSVLVARQADPFHEYVVPSVAGNAMVARLRAVQRHHNCLERNANRLEVE